MDDAQRASGILSRTLENAARAPYYKRTWQGRHLDVGCEADMTRLPLLDKATAIRHQRELIVGEPPPGFGLASSGTTRTADLAALNVLRSPEELAAIVGDPLEPASDAWSLWVVAVHHGLPQSAARHDELRVPWSYHRNALSMIQACIERPQPDGRRVTSMRISAGALKTVTTWFLENHIDAASFGVHTIATTGSRLSPHWRALIASAWRATLYDNFSLSEVPTPATECDACGALHFRSPPVLYEVLDLLSGAQLRRGHGRLVLTTMHPWVQTMPLVRYDTGDVVDLGAVCPGTGQPQLTYLGRARRGIAVPTSTTTAFVLAPVFVQDILEAMPATERSPHPAVVNGLTKSRDLGFPRFRVESEALGTANATVRLHFEVRFDPLIYRESAQHLEDEVRSGLRRLDAALTSLLDAGALQLDVCAHAPGTLEPPGDKFE